MPLHPRSFTKERFIQAPRERVWRALTEMEELNHWETIRGEIDLRTGGYFWFDFEYGAADEGYFLEITRPSRLVQHWVSQVTEEVKEDLVSVVTLDEVDGGTRLHVVMDGYGRDEGQQWLYETMSAGWEKDLVCLKLYLETGRDARPIVWTGQEIGAAYTTLPARRAFEVGTSSGVYVLKVWSGKPAARAGIQPGDTIVALGGFAVHAFPDMIQALKAYRPGDEVTLEYLRDRRRHRVPVTIGNSRARLAHA